VTSRLRAELWRDVYTEHLTIHDQGETWADVTEGNPWPIGLVCERLRYEWSQPGSVRGTVIESNLFKPGSTWEIRATPNADGGSLVEILACATCGEEVGSLRPFVPLARRDVAAYLRQFLGEVENS
jgi:hypothetical protein